MRAIIAATALLALLASTVTAYDAYRLLLDLGLDSEMCVFPVNENTQNVSAPNGNVSTVTKVLNVDTPKTSVSYNISVNPCYPVDFRCSNGGGAYVTLAPSATTCVGAISFDEELDSTWQNLTLTRNLRSSADRSTASLIIECDPTSLLLTFVNANVSGTNFMLTYTAASVCNAVTDAPVPVPTPGSSSSKLSTGAVVGIIAGSAVVVVSLGVAVTKFRASGPGADGDYSRVV